MAFTYLILNLAFCTLALVILRKTIHKPRTAWWITLIAVLALTAVFDSLIIWAGIVDYDTTKLLGWYIGYAPVEDFFYAILAAIVVPALWHYSEKRNHGNT